MSVVRSASATASRAGVSVVWSRCGVWPWYALSACLLFGLLQAVALRYQNIDLGTFVVPVQVMDSLPYIPTVVILAGFVGKAIPRGQSASPM